MKAVHVFVRRLELRSAEIWISYRGSEDGVTPCEFIMWFYYRFCRGV